MTAPTTPTPPRLTPERWRALVDICTRLDAIANRGAGAPKDAMAALGNARFSVNDGPNMRSVSAMLAENESGPGAASTAPDPANPDETGADA